MRFSRVATAKGRGECKEVVGEDRTGVVSDKQSTGLKVVGIME